MYECLVSMCIFAPQVYSACEGQKRALDSLKLELQAVISHQVVARNPTQIFSEQQASLTSESLL